MKNFQGLRKCATGAVINTEDFMKSNQATTGSMLEGLTGDGGDKRRRKASKKANTYNKRSICPKGSNCYKPGRNS